MNRRRLGENELGNVGRLVVIFALAALGCARHTRATPLPGEYKQSSVRLNDGHNIVNAVAGDPIASTFPTLVRLDQESGFEVENGDAQLHGKFRLERDSIFLDQESEGGTQLAFAGRVIQDTLALHWIPVGGANPSGADVQLRFVRAK